MIPKGPLGRQQLSNCKIYNGPDHSHQAQNPTQLDISKLNKKKMKVLFLIKKKRQNLILLNCKKFQII